MYALTGIGKPWKADSTVNWNLTGIYEFKPEGQRPESARSTARLRCDPLARELRPDQ
jgi:hypothetical protein